MSDKVTFKIGVVKQAVGWFSVLASGAALTAMIYAITQNPEVQTPTELGSAAAIGVFLLVFLFGGLVVQSLRWTAEGDTITLRHMFGSKTWTIGDLGGFGKLIIIATVFPMAHIQLFDRALKPVGRLGVTLKDMPAAEAWLSQRLRYVVDDGSPAQPRRRFFDAT